MALRRRGWTTVPQVGVSKFRIDLGIVHPDRPGDYLVGVECDGAAYHSAATAGDRDRVRAAILEGLGWTLVRIWSTDWWIDKERAADRLHEQIEAVLAADRLRTADREAAIAGATSSITRSPAPDTPLIDPDGDVAHEPDDEVVPATTAIAPLIREPVAEPSYARAAAAPYVDASTNRDDRYRATDFAKWRGAIKPGTFHDPSYDAVLRSLIAHVLETEAPIAEPLLVQRIARAHGFQRAGRIIRDRVMGIVQLLHFVENEPGGGSFVWPDAASRDAWNRARWPASPDDVRQIEEIALAELRAAKAGRQAVELARDFGVRRLSAAARARVESAQ